MASTPSYASWPRPHFRKGGGDPLLFYKAHGQFGEDFDLDLSEYRSLGVPRGCDLRLYERSRDDDVFEFGLHDQYGERLRNKGPSAFDEAARSPHCAILRGELDDPPSLDYFRDVIGLFAALFDNGAVALFDPFLRDWWTPEEWRTLVFETGLPDPLLHTRVASTREEGTSGLVWVHTRGMLRFGRPDISLRHVPAALEASAHAFCTRLIEECAAGRVVDDGEGTGEPTALGDWRCFLEGDYDDPEFHNRRLEVRPPEPKPRTERG